MNRLAKNDSFGSISVVVLQYLCQGLSFSRSGVQGEATPECIAPAVIWNIPLGFSNDLLMALMSPHRGALLHMDLVERREGDRGRKVNTEIGSKIELM